MFFINMRDISLKFSEDNQNIIECLSCSLQIMSEGKKLHVACYCIIIYAKWAGTSAYMFSIYTLI